MRFGIGSYTFPWAVGSGGARRFRPLDALGLIEIARRDGWDIVQICENMPVQDWDAVFGSGIAIEIGTRGIDSLADAIPLAQRAGTGFVRLVIDSGEDRPSADEASSRLRTFVGPAREAGVRIAIENHDRFPAVILRQIIEDLGTDVAAAVFDTANSLGALEGPEEVVRILGPHILCFHYKDIQVQRMPHQLGFSVYGTAAGEGQISAASLLRRMPSVQSVILELWTPPEATPEATIVREQELYERSLPALRRLREQRVDWDAYLDATAGKPAHYLYEKAAPFLAPVGRAVELGCGPGNGVLHLLNLGWRVEAVDSEPRALRILEERAKGYPGLSTRLERLEAWQPDGEYDLAVAGFCLFFVDPARIRHVWRTIERAIRPGGLFIGQFLGLEDDWAHLVRHPEEEVRAYLQDFEILYWEEARRMGMTATGGTKHWHIYHVIARKLGP